MKLLKVVGLSLLASFALAAFASANAFAEAGFSPTPVEAHILGGASKLEPATGGNVACTKLDDATVIFSNRKTATATLRWLGCKAFGFAANSEGDKAEEFLERVTFLVCLDPKNGGKLVDEFGVAVEVLGTAHLVVPAVGATITVTGVALGAMLTSGTARLFNVEILGAKGSQIVNQCLQGGTSILQSLFTTVNLGLPVATSENIEAGLFQFSENTVLVDS